MTPREVTPPPSSQQKHSIAERILNILYKLVQPEEVVGILTLSYSSDKLNGLSRPHKDAALLFLDWVYGTASSKLLHKLLSEALLPDLMLVLRLITE